jgi:hypothetical protein
MSGGNQSAVSGKDPMLRLKMAEVDKPKIQKREVRRYKGRYFALKLVAIWALVMATLAVGGHFFWRDNSHGNQGKLADRVVKDSQTASENHFLSQAYTKCAENLSGFLAAGTPEVRNQFVRTPLDTAGRMARFYQENPFENFDVSGIRGKGTGVIHLGDGRKLVETRWAAADGRTFDAVFFEEQDGWRLDWEEFVRYSEHPWHLFLSGSGDGEGEFRLYARERLAGQRIGKDDILIALHAPRFGHPGEATDASAELSVDQDSEAGRILLQAFEIRKEGGRVYGSSLPNQDPEDMIRVRVKVRRADSPTGRTFTIEEVKACHWLSIDDSGLSR